MNNLELIQSAAMGDAGLYGAIDLGIGHLAYPYGDMPFYALCRYKPGSCEPETLQWFSSLPDALDYAATILRETGH